ncbi:MAG: glycosyltransferase [Chlorobiaceae bacterium]|nr:glycosyltransferase [Chlorobiaceae bacterium]
MSCAQPDSVFVKKNRFEIKLTIGFLMFTVVAYTCVIYEQFRSLGLLFEMRSWSLFATHVLFLVMISFLVYGGILYHLTRIGYFKRFSKNRNNSEKENSLIQQKDAPRLTILVPSYKEEQKVIMQTLLSAAFQLYPRRRVVLLIDDPQVPPSAGAAYRQLCEARELPRTLSHYFDTHKQKFAGLENAFLTRTGGSQCDISAEKTRLNLIWAEMESYFAAKISTYDIENHVDELFVKLIYEKLKSIFTDKLKLGIGTSREELAREYRFLVILFDVQLDSFERKRYVNLSHASNKAMNLNSYIGLTNGFYREEHRPEGLMLLKCEDCEADLVVPGTDFFITLDADSLLVPEYSTRLISIMESPENSSIGIAQTPYSAIPGADNHIERIAGATTDIQYLIHQGFTFFNATYWVGANALIRVAALQDIRIEAKERGYDILKFIQDKTVIEDTESSIDLAHNKWRLYNHPERLAYSATPPDFGSLVIQRRRWANGGLLIMPKLLKYLFREFSFKNFLEGFFRFHYLVSIAAVNIGLLLLMVLPFGKEFNSFWLPLTSLTYYILYARDLNQNGYRISDVFRVYALNLLLIPVNLGGVFKSIEQALTGKHIPFSRTPKVQGRTAASPLYIIASYLLFLQFFAGGLYSIYKGFVYPGCFSLLNAAFLFYAIVRYIGLKESMEDLKLTLAEKMPAPKPAFSAPQLPKHV